MKLILYRWYANNESILYHALQTMGHTVICCDRKCKHYTRDVELGSELITLIRTHDADGVISLNYFPIISLACDAAGVKYYSWVYDNPHHTLYAKTVSLPCNRIGIFDKTMVKELNDRGINTPFHLPLAVDSNRVSDVIHKNKSSKYASDVSFVGSLYSGTNNFYDLIYKDVPEIDAHIRNCAFGSVDDFFSLMHSKSFGFQYAIDKMQELGLALGDDYYQCSEEIVKSIVYERKITEFERTELMRKLSGLDDLSFSLYTDSETSLSNKGTVDYETEMPLVFANSKINLNITLRSIHSGIPLRVLDIMACGGFMLTNRQPEIAECFVENKEVVFFDSIEECIDKMKYYLVHDTERVAIAKAGKNKVISDFSYNKLLPILLDIK